MLVRRFSIVCLIFMLFGIAFSAFIQNVTRPARSWEIGQVVPCIFENGRVCAPPSKAIKGEN